MDTKSLLTGIISFIAGALLVSTAATTFDKPEPSYDSMSAMIQTLEDKSGDDFDRAFISQMIVHHKGAIDMAKLIDARAKHAEIKQLGQEIISAQSKEIDLMQSWQKDWGYANTPQSHEPH